MSLLLGLTVVALPLQTVSIAEVIVGTGNDDLREGSRVSIIVQVARQPDLVVEIARRRRFPDRTSVTESISLRPGTRLEEIEQVSVFFQPDKRDLMNDDQWEMRSFEFRVRLPDGSWRTLFSRTTPFKFEREQTFRSGRLPTFTGSTGSIVTVRDDAGRLVPGATIFVGTRLAGTTDSNGEWRSATAIAATDRVIAKHRVHQQGTYRGNHRADAAQNWNYRVYFTNVQVSSTGLLQATSRRTGSNIDLVVSRNNTLIGANIVASIEWDASSAEFSRVQSLLQNASNYLYNATDGQFYFERVTVVERKSLWDDCDYRIYADANMRARVNSHRGGFLGWNVQHTCMHESRSDDMTIYAHEFGHYGLDLGDEYSDDDGTIQCTSNQAMTTSPFTTGTAMAACMMWNQWSAPKICSDHASNPHRRGTRQGDTPCWTQLASRYNHSPVWNVRTPTTRGALLPTIAFAAGLSTIPVFSQPILEGTNSDSTNLIPNARLTVSGSSFGPLQGRPVDVIDSRGNVLRQGLLNSAGMLALAGVHRGDRIKIDLEGGAIEIAATGTADVRVILVEPESDERLHAPAPQVTPPGQQPGQPIRIDLSRRLGSVDIVATASSDGIDFVLTSEEDLVGAPNVSVFVSPTSRNLSPQLTSINSRTFRSSLREVGPYSEMFMRVIGNSRSGRDVVGHFQLTSASRISNVEGEFFSGDGAVSLSVPWGVGRIAISRSDRPLTGGPAGLMQVSATYQVSHSPGNLPSGTTLRLRLPMQQGRLMDSSLDLTSIRLYRHDTNLNRWTQVNGVLNQRWGQISLKNPTAGTYAIFGRRR
ncbi:MAG: hypothetical protein KIT74_05085 [Fimbriimonadales bacterium]|nr:hypothetical protein [Fimbriimonadales bacterium]